MVLSAMLLGGMAGAQTRLPVSETGAQATRGVVDLEAKQQRTEGKVFYAEGDVDIRYEGMRLQADHVEYHTDTGDAAARGNVRFDRGTQHLEAEEARYNLRSGKGSFLKVKGTIRLEREPNPNVLMSLNPFWFEAKSVERGEDGRIEIRNAWVTVCEPGKEIWRFQTTRATIRIEKSVRLENATFRLLDVPVLYLPVATTGAGRKQRHTGFLVPHFGNTSRKGFVIGDSFYWAPNEWMDVTLGAEYLSRRGHGHQAGLRARPWENVRVNATYYGVNDRGLPGPGGGRVPQSGHESRFELDAFLEGGWRAVADINQLTSLTFRLAFAETFAEAARPEVRSTAFVTNNFHGISVNFSTYNYKNFLSAAPETAVVLRAAPGARVSSVEQAPWEKAPLYFGFHVLADAAHRSEPGLETPAAVQRTELAPRVTLPLRWGPWLGVNTTATLRTTRYGSQLMAGTVVGDSLRRTTGEVNVDIRPPALGRIWDTAGGKWKHTVEPQVVYRFVDGVNEFGRFLRFDENDTLTDTNELEYGFTQRFYRRGNGEGQAKEIGSWRMTQKHYFDPTFGGALTPGQRNVFQALQTVTPYAFADGARDFSPLVNDVRLLPGGRYDAQVRIDYDTQKGKILTFGTLVKLRPYRESFVTLAHFATRGGEVLQPKSHQVRALVGYGEIHRKGLNGSFGFSYDVRERFLQNQVVQVSLNGSCCGIGFEYRRLALGAVRSENQFRVALMIANIGTFGNLRRQEKIF